MFAHNVEPSALSRIWLCIEYEVRCSSTLKMCFILLGSVDVSKDWDAICKIDLCSREDMCISSNLVSISLIVGKNHPQSACESSLQTLVHSCILTSKTDQDFSLYLSGIKGSILTKQTALSTTWLSTLPCTITWLCPKKNLIQNKHWLNCFILTPLQPIH